MAAIVLAILAPAPARALDPGDSNRDRRVSAADVPALLRILAGQPANDGADANRDGFVLDDDLGATFARIFERPLAEPTTTPTASATTTATTTATAASTTTRTPTMPESTPTGTATRSSTPTATPSSGPSHTATATGSASPAPSFTPSSTPVFSPTPTHSAAPTSTSSATPMTPSTPTNTPTATSTGIVPTNTPTVTQTQPPLATVTRTATQMATQTPPPTPTASATRTVTVAGPIAVTRCSNTLPTPLAIPDGNLQGVSNTFTVPDNVSIADLDVAIEIDHPFIGDLRITLTHVTTNTIVVLVDRPGAGDCGGANISCTFDDNAARFASFVCSQHDPSLGGGIIPDGFLGELTGQSLAGTWRLTVADQATRDVGTLVSWCLRANSTAPVVTRITCNDEPECSVGLGEPYVLEFDFRDRDGNANGYRVTARDDRGNLFPLNDDPIVPAKGEGTITLNFNDGFSCNAPPCVTTEFEFFVTVRDAGGQESPFASLLITSLGTQ